MTQSLSAPGLVSGPALLQQPPLVPPAMPAVQPVAAAQSSASSSDGSANMGQSGGNNGAVYVPQRQEERPALYDKPSALDASASPPAKKPEHLNPYGNGDTAYQEPATLAAPPASSAKPVKNYAEIAASQAYALIAGAGTMPDRAMHPLRGD